MAGENIQSMTRKILTFLQANLADPLNDRASAFIYDDDTRIDLDKSGFPKILLKKKDEVSNKEQLGLGNASTINTDNIVIQVKTEAGSKYEYSSSTYTALEFAGLIAQLAEDLIKLNHAHWITEGFLHVICVKDEFIEDRDRNPTFNLEIEMKYISNPNP